MPHQRPEAIANEFLDYAGPAGLTQIQLQKLVYIAHGWTLALTGGPLTSYEPEAWDRGPVYRGMRKRINYAGSEPITQKIREKDHDPFAVLKGRNRDRGPVIEGRFTEDEKNILRLIWDRYGSLHGFTLSDLTHAAGTPWDMAYHERGRDSVISNASTRAHYVGLLEQVAGGVD